MIHFLKSNIVSYTNPDLFLVIFCLLKHAIQFYYKLKWRTTRSITNARIQTHNLLIMSLLLIPLYRGFPLELKYF